jgi:hypothetical protein
MANDLANQPARSLKRGRITKGMATAVGILALCSLLCAWLVSYAQYKSSHEIPNPLWGVFGKVVTYTPEQGPPSPDLVVTRPEAVVLQYISDYQKLAGTYPCAQDLANYSEEMDPVLYWRPCPIHRSVRSVVVRLVQIGASQTSHLGLGPFQIAEANVHVEITYADGLQHAMTLTVEPEHRQTYWLTYLHMDCWRSLGILSIYPQRIAQVPHGASYGLDTQGYPLCQR